MTASWTTEFPCELDASQQVSRLHSYLDSLLLHPGIVYALQDPLHLALQLGPLRHQPLPVIDFSHGRLILETTYQRVHFRTVRVVLPEKEEVGGVVTGT